MYERMESPWKDTLDKYADPARAARDLHYKAHIGDLRGDYKDRELYKEDTPEELYLKRQEEEKEEKEQRDNIDQRVEEEQKKKDEEEEPEKAPRNDSDPWMIQEQIEGIKERSERRDPLKSVEELILEMSQKKGNEVINLDAK